MARHVISSAHPCHTYLLFTVFYLSQLVGLGEPHDLSSPIRTLVWEFWTSALDNIAILLEGSEAESDEAWRLSVAMDLLCG